MANFTGGIKKDLLTIKLTNEQEKRAWLSACLRTSGCLSYAPDTGFGFVLITESEKVAERFMRYLDELYGVTGLTSVTEDKLSGKTKLSIAYNGETSYDILIDLTFFVRQGRDRSYNFYYGISKKLFADEDCKLAYIIGAFLGSGSCTVPNADVDNKTGYHLEFIFSVEQTAKEFINLLSEYEILAKLVQRKESYVVYLTALSAICDFLAVTGANASLDKLSRMAEEREDKNNSNRVNNCFVGNMDRTATAAAKQVIAIQYLKDEGLLNPLDEELFKTAEMRLQHPQASLKELSELLFTGKSCINHRMRKLMSIYEDAKKNEQNMINKENGTND